MLRLAGIWQPLVRLTVTPSMFYQNDQKHDVSKPIGPPIRILRPVVLRQCQSRTASPVPDRFYLPALKIEADLGPARFISNTSYYTVTNSPAMRAPSTTFATIRPRLAAIPAAIDVNPTLYPLIDTTGIHLPPHLTNYQSPATVQNSRAVSRRSSA